MKKKMRFLTVLLSVLTMITILSMIIIILHLNKGVKTFNPMFVIIEILNTIYITLIFFVNRKVIKKTLLRKKSIKKKCFTSAFDVLEKFSKAQLKKNTMALILVFVCLFIYSCLYFLCNINLEYNVLIILNILPWLIIFHRILLSYRIKNQFYGMNYVEAKEILYFIKESHDDDSQNGKFYFSEEKCKIPAADRLVEYL